MCFRFTSSPARCRLSYSAGAVGAALARTGAVVSARTLASQLTASLFKPSSESKGLRQAIIINLPGYLFVVMGRSERHVHRAQEDARSPEAARHQ